MLKEFGSRRANSPNTAHRRELGGFREEILSNESSGGSQEGLIQGISEVTGGTPVVVRRSPTT